MTVQEKIAAKHRNVYTALAAAQSEMDTVRKGSVNPAFKSRYADLADVMSAALPAFNRNGLAMFHQMVRDASGELVMRAVAAHGESDTQIHCDVPLIVSKNDMQGMKSAVTYAKRIGAESLAGIAPDDDDGNAAVTAAPKAEAKPTGPTDKALADARAQLDAATSLQDLQQRWMNLPTAIKADIGVTAAKDARKDALQAPASDLGGDDVPY